MLQVDRRAPQNATMKLAKLIDTLHAYQARILVRNVSSWDEATQLVRVGVDLISLIAEERNATAAADGRT